MHITIVEFEIVAGKKPPAFHVEIPTSGGVSVVFPSWIREIPTSECRAQPEPHKFCCLENKSASGLQ